LSSECVDRYRAECRAGRDDDPLRAELSGAQLVMRAKATQIFANCPRDIVRSYPALFRLAGARSAFAGAFCRCAAAHLAGALRSASMMPSK